MTEVADLPCLLYALPHDPQTTHIYPIHTTITCLGRLTTQPTELSDAATLLLDLPTISLRHAQILRTPAGYLLQNWQGRYGVGLYERELRPGESYLLTHGDTFRIPARAEYVRLYFLHTQQQTQRIPLAVERTRRAVYVFGERVPLTPLEYRLVAYLHQHTGDVCSYTALMTTLWGDAQPFARKGNLEVLLHAVRAKLRTASGGFTFLETVPGQGVRLVI